MEIRRKTNGKTQLFLIALGIMAFFYGIKHIYIFSNNITVETINDLMQIVSYAVLAVIILKKSFNYKWLKYIAVAGAIILLGLDRSRSTSILRFFLLVLASRGICYKKILKTLLATYSSVLFISVFLFVVGLSDPEVDEGLSLGFTHPNIASLIITTIMFLWLCLQEKINFKNMIILFLAAGLIFVLLKTRVAAICLVLLPFIYEIIQVGIKKDSHIIKRLVCCSQIIMCAVSVIMVVIYPMAIYNPFRSRIDQFFAYRPYLNFNNIMKYGVSLWGQNVSIYNTSEYAFNYYTGYVSNQKFNTVDNGYILSLIVVGIIPMLITMVCFVLVQKKAWSNKNKILLSIGVMFALYAFIENGANEALIVFPYYYLLTVDDTKNAKAYAGKNMAAETGLYRRYGVDT